MVGIIERRLRGRGGNQSARESVDSVFFHEEGEVRTVTHSAGSQNMTAILIPDPVVKHCTDILRGAAKRQHAVFVCFGPDIEIVGSPECLETPFQQSPGVVQLTFGFNGDDKLSHTFNHSSALLTDDHQGALIVIVVISAIFVS